MAGLTDEESDTPPIVSVSDIHGYLDDGRSALLAVGDHHEYDPLVEPDDSGRLHWAGNDYVLVLNGDLIDRGPASAATLEMARRLAREAPLGRVRMTIGNHEMALMLPAVVRWPQWYSGSVGVDERQRFFEDVLTGRIVAAYQGYEYTYAHAGRPEPYDVATVNEALVAATRRLADAVDSPGESAQQRAVAEEYDAVFGTGGPTGRGPGAGIAWLDFQHMPPDAPAQVVGHTRHRRPTRKGSVVCENVIRTNRESPGGEAALVETPDGVVAIRRGPDGGVIGDHLE